MYTIEETMKEILTMENVFPLVEEFNGRPDAVLRAQCAIWAMIWERCIGNCSSRTRLLYPGIEMLEEAFLDRGLVDLARDGAQRLWVELENDKYMFEVSKTGRLTGNVSTFSTQIDKDVEIDMQVMDVVHFTVVFDSMIPDINDAVEQLFFRYEIEQKVKQIEKITNGKCKR